MTSRHNPAGRPAASFGGVAAALGALLLLAFASQATAQDPAEPAPADAIISAEEIVQGLTPPPRTRGLVIEPGGQQQSLVPAEAPSIDLAVQFAFGSDQLTDQAVRQLDALGTALTSEALRPYRFEAAGHTDSVGSDAFNLDLSQRRAEAVRRYLMENFAIEADRVAGVGYGEAQPADAADPENGVNRRVEITNLGERLLN